MATKIQVPEESVQDIADGLNYVNGILWAMTMYAPNADQATNISTACQNILKEASDKLSELDKELKLAKLNNIKPATEDRRFL